MTSYILTKSISPKQKNEDYIDNVINNRLHFKAIILADGIGSHYKSDEGSEFCVKSLKKHIENCPDITTIDFKHLFKKVYNELKDNFREIKDENIDKTKAYGTTLICVVELEDKFLIAYLGNGSVWHIRGNFEHFSRHRYLPWSALNLLNPHTIEENGKEVLYKFIALESVDNQIQPSIIEISKDNILYGDIIIASTDGLYSNDHNPIAKDREGNIWIAGERKMELLFNRLKDLKLKNSFEEHDINKSLNEFISDLNTNKLIDDDTTFGIIINTVTSNEPEPQEIPS